MGLKNEYPDLVNTANDVLFAFRFMCLCEVSFSAMAAIHSRFQHVHFRIRLSNY